MVGYHRWLKYLSSQLFLRFAVLQRSSAVEKLIDKNSKSPDVCFWAISIINEALRTHVDRASYTDIFKATSSPNRKAKIAYFVLSLMYEDVGYFKIPVNNP
jgi:hypothetical protein